MLRLHQQARSIQLDLEDLLLLSLPQGQQLPQHLAPLRMIGAGFVEDLRQALRPPRPPPGQHLLFPHRRRAALGLHPVEDADRYALAMLVRAADADGRRMTDLELRDQLMTLLLAGHDTTATALSWALERLTRHPEVLAVAVAAARAAADGDPAGDEYLDAVARETLRLRPVVFDVGRLLKEPVEVAGYRLPAGVTVIPAIGLVHTDANHYDDPDEFRPERMLATNPTEATTPPGRAAPAHRWLPFGGGNRRCLGANLALTEMRVVLREVLRRVELVPTSASGERPRPRGVIQHPHRGALIRVRSI